LISQILAILIPLTIALSVELTGNNNKLGFMLGFLVQVLNGFYAILTQHWGWLLGPAIVGPIFYRNYRKWKKRQSGRQPAQDDLGLQRPVAR